MKISVSEGNYVRLGAKQGEGRIVFTFCGEKEDECAVVLVSRHGGELTRIRVPEQYCVGSLRSVAVSGLDAAEYMYYYEVNGERRLDPCAHRIVGREVWNDGARRENGYEVFGAFADEEFDWKGDEPPEIPASETFLYKLHVRGFTMEAGLKHPGTFSALMNRIGYLERLGVTAVELMPAYEFEEMPVPLPPKEKEIPDYIQWEPGEDDLIRPEPAGEEAPVGQLNYWGYGDGNYFAVKASYASEPEHAPREFKELVRRLHEHRMECVMEMYFPEKVNHNMILEILRYWVFEYHVDGFHLLGEGVPVDAVVQDPVLSRTKIFCGGFGATLAQNTRPFKSLFVYKDEYMYPARRILNSLGGNMRDFVDQQRKQGSDHGYVNYIAGNNGFTLADLFMYNDRHNEANGEGNRDGCAWNYSNNYGIEGPTRKRYINALRKLKWRNSVMMLMLAQGVPLLWSGDEFGNSQQGNNNAYCQDNPTGWVNWRNEKTHRDQLAFLRQLVQFRRQHPVLGSEQPFRFSDYRSLGMPDLSFHGGNAWIIEPDAGRMCLGMLYSGAYSPDGQRDEDVYVAYNFFSAVSELALPQPDREKRWYLVMDSGNEKTPYFAEPVLQDSACITMAPQSIRVFVARREERRRPERNQKGGVKKHGSTNIQEGTGALQDDHGAQEAGAADVLSGGAVPPGDPA